MGAPDPIVPVCGRQSPTRPGQGSVCGGLSGLPISKVSLPTHKVGPRK
jgi:hypothetical protein